VGFGKGCDEVLIGGALFVSAKGRSSFSRMWIQGMLKRGKRGRSRQENQTNTKEKASRGVISKKTAS